MPTVRDHVVGGGEACKGPAWKESLGGRGGAGGRGLKVRHRLCLSGLVESP